MDLVQLYAEAEKITDPEERRRRMAEITRLALGSPVRAAATAAVGGGVSPPTVETDPRDLARLEQDINLTAKLKNTKRIDAFSDEELEQLIEGFSSNVDPKEAKSELSERKRIDEQGTIRNLIDPKALVRQAGNVVAGAAEIPTSTPIALAGLLATGGEFVTGTDLQADELLAASEEIRQNIRSSIGISDPRNISESVAGMIPSVVGVPGKAPATVLGNLAEVVTPLVVGSGNKRILANFATGLVAEQGIRELADEVGAPYETAFDQVGFTGGLVDDKSYPEMMKPLGIGLAGMAGASIVTPMIAKQMRTNPFRKTYYPEPIKLTDPHAPDNLKTLERAGDVYKTYIVDEKEVLKDLSKRAAMPDFDEVGKLIDQDTQMSALMRVNEAMRTGALRTKTGSFKVDITPNQLFQEYQRLPPAMQTDADMYLKYKDYADTLELKIANNVDVTDSQAKLRQANKAAYEIELRTPVVKEFSSRYRHITENVRDFLGQGDNAMLSPKALEKLALTRKNFVPSDVLGVNPEEGILQRITDVTRPIEQRQMDNWYRQNQDELLEGVEGKANSFEMLVDYTRNALKSKMEHDVRGAYIRGMKESIYGFETIRPATPKEAQLYPKRVVEVWEGGQRKKYLSSELQAQLLKFDPYIAKYPTTFMAKRLFEQGTTGPASVVFAPVTALRDSIGGWVFMDKGAKGPGSLAVAAAIPKQIWAKSQLAAVEMLQNNLQRVPFLTEQSRNQMAQQISNSYMNSMYHLANEVGGFDASLMKHNVQAARGVMREIGRSTGSVAGNIPGAKFLGRNVNALIHGFSTVFDAIQEAPRFAAFERNVRAGMDPRDAAIKARNITGDTTRSGRVYDPRGVRISGDVQNKAALAPAALVGGGVEFLRAATPYFNPMIQGMRRMANSFIDNPLQTNIRAWTSVGLPALVMMGWNEMLGEDYNRFAFEQRSSRDIAMNMYMGIPGLPPEKGIQIPIPHELTLFNSPWTTGLYSTMRGDETDDVKAMMMHMAGTSLENSAMVGFPQLATAGLSMMGTKAPQSILNPTGWQDEVYNIREDNVGMLPQNIELTLRNLFGSVADTALQTSAAFYEGGPEAFFDELGHNILKRTPIAKNLAGTTTPVSNFTPLSEAKQTKVDSLWEFLDIYEEHISKETLLRESNMPDTKGRFEDTDAMTRHRMAPIPTPAPTNPIILEYGDMIKGTLDGNSEGMTGLKARHSILTQQLRNLRSYTSGRRDGFREWQKTVNGADAKYQEEIADLESRKEGMTKREYQKELKAINGGVGEAAKLERLYKDLKLDMSKRSDVNKLIGHLEQQRIELTNQQLKLIEIVEDKLTMDLVARGMLPPGKRFDITKHLTRNTPPTISPASPSPAMPE